MLRDFMHSCDACAERFVNSTGAHCSHIPEIAAFTGNFSRLRDSRVLRREAHSYVSARSSQSRQLTAHGAFRHDRGARAEHDGLIRCSSRAASHLKISFEFELHRLMNSLPMELRRRIVEAYEKKEGTYFELAQRFGVGEATVYRLLKLKREQGNVKPGAPTGVTEEELPEFVQLVNEFPDATL